MGRYRLSPKILAVFLLSPATAHLIMNTPTPYTPHGASGVQINPLGEKFTFPCQGYKYEVAEATALTAGSSTLVTFNGTAAHGGGSCQFSVNYGHTPSADPSEWKTIFTIIGGCPAEAAGNLAQGQTDADGRYMPNYCGNSGDKECMRHFDIPIPKDLPNGKASFAWTWFNKIGNREMYMNCAPVEITGGASDASFLDSLPPIFTANIAGTFDCVTGQGGPLNIPNPGRFGAMLEPPAGEPGTSCPATSALPGFPTTMPAAAATRSKTRPSQHTAAGASGSTAAATGPVSHGTSCSPDGALICMGAGFFGLCSNGYAVKQPLAAGTVCEGGKIAKRTFWVA